MTLCRILVHYLYSRIFTAAFTSRLLQTVQESLFSDGHPAPSMPDPTLQEQADMKKRAVRVIAAALPGRPIRYSRQWNTMLTCLQNRRGLAIPCARLRA